MRDMNRDLQNSTRKEPSIGDYEFSEVRPVESLRKDRKQTSSEPRRKIRDVLMEDESESEGITGRRLPKPQVVREKRRVTNRVESSIITGQSSRVAGRWFKVKGWLKKVGVGCLVSAALWGGYKAIGPIQEMFQRPIRHVTVEGEFHFITQEHATQLIMQEIDEDFLQINLVDIKNVLLADPWVESVVLTRRWPDTLVVRIAEQKPIARWGNGFLNHLGKIVETKDARGLDGLPWLQGDEEYAGEILQQYQDLSLLLRSHGLEIEGLSCDSKRSWRLKLTNNVEIAIGRDQVMEKMRRFVTVYEAQLQALWSDIKSIDIRYTNGVAVRWIEASETAKRMIKNDH